MAITDSTPTHEHGHLPVSLTHSRNASIHPFIQIYIEYLYMPGTVLGTKDAA